MPPAPDIPGGAYLLDIFWELHESRSWDGGAPMPIKPADIVGWQQLAGMALNPSERRILAQLDGTFRNEVDKERQGAAVRGQPAA